MKKITLNFIFVLMILPSVFASEVWNEKSHFGGEGRHRGTGLAIGNKGYIGFGHYNGSGINYMKSDWWEFDPSSNSWSQKADYPFQTYAAAQFAIGMKGYVGCGVSAGNLWYAYDPIQNTWAAIQSSPVGNTDQLGFSVNEKGYYLNWTSLYEYDPLLDQWTQKLDVPFGASSWPSAFTIDEKAYVKSGTQLYEYKPSTDQWIARAPFPGLASGGSASFAVNSKGYIVCGYIGWLSELSSEVWEFDPALNVWTLMTEFPGNGRRFSSGFAIGNKGYVGIGTTGTNMRDFWEFDELLSTPKIELDVEIEEPFPNPSSTVINFNITPNSQLNNTTILLKIIDVNGRAVYFEKFAGTNHQVSKNEIGEGLFIYQILANDSTIKTGKLIFE